MCLLERRVVYTVQIFLKMELREKGEMDLSGNSDLIVTLIAKGALSGVRVVECDGYCCSGDSSLATLVHQVLQIARTNLWSVSERVMVSHCAGYCWPSECTHLQDLLLG